MAEGLVTVIVAREALTTTGRGVSPSDLWQKPKTKASVWYWMLETSGSQGRPLSWGDTGETKE